MSSVTSTWKNIWPGAARAARTPASSHAFRSGRKAAGRPSWNSLRQASPPHITVVDTERMSPDYLGLPLTTDLIAAMEKDNIDVCGENGEYHTFVTGGPLFKTPLDIKFSAPIPRGRYLTLEVE